MIKGRRGRAAAWATTKTYKTRIAALEGLAEIQRTHSRYNTQDTARSINEYWSCRARGCDHEIRVRHLCSSLGIIVESNGRPHSHDESVTAASRTDLDQARAIAIELLKRNGATPAAINQELGIQGLPAIAERRLTNLVQRLKRSAQVANPNGLPRQMSLNDLDVWCQNYSEFPLDLDEAFILDRQLMVSGTTTTVRVFITTRHLLSIAAQFDTWHIDATYKLNLNRYPLIVLGVTDHAKAFHPSAWLVSTSEKTEDYQFALETLCRGARTRVRDIVCYG